MPLHCAAGRGQWRLHGRGAAPVVATVALTLPGRIHAFSCPGGCQGPVLADAKPPAQHQQGGVSYDMRLHVCGCARERERESVAARFDAPPGSPPSAHISVPVSLALWHSTVQAKTLCVTTDDFTCCHVPSISNNRQNICNSHAVVSSTNDVKGKV